MGSVSEKQTYTITEACQVLGISRSSMHRAMKRNELSAFRIGSKVLIPREVVDNLVGGGGKPQRRNRHGVVRHHNKGNG